MARLASLPRTAYNTTYLLGRAPAQDALLRKFHTQLGYWTQWLNRNSAKGFLSEFGWPNRLNNVDAYSWDKAGYLFMRMLNDAGIDWTVWSCQEEFSLPSPPLVIYSALPPASGAPCTLRQSQADIVEQCISPYAGINFDGNSQLALADGGFDGGSRFFGVANGSGISPNPGVYSVDWSYPNPLSLIFLRGRGIPKIRLPIRWERLQPMLGAALDATELARIQNVLAQCAAAGMECMVDLHNTGQYSLWDGTSYTLPAITGSGTAQTVLIAGGTAGLAAQGILLVTGGGGTPHYVNHITVVDGTHVNAIFPQTLTGGAIGVQQGVLRDVGSAQVTQANLVDFWNRLSLVLKGSAGLWGYDIMNEPKNIAASTWETQSQAVVTGIRSTSTDTTSKISVMGSHFGNPDDWTTRHPVAWITDTAGKLYYGAHYYFDAFSLVDGNFLDTYAVAVTNAAAQGF